jgi:hypothetical protein
MILYCIFFYLLFLFFLYFFCSFISFINRTNYIHFIFDISSSFRKMCSNSSQTTNLLSSLLNIYLTNSSQ